MWSVGPLFIIYQMSGLMVLCVLDVSPNIKSIGPTTSMCIPFSVPVPPLQALGPRPPGLDVLARQAADGDVSDMWGVWGDARGKRCMYLHVGCVG